MTTDTSRMPYQLPFPPEAADEMLVSPAIPEDERVWVPQAEGVWFRPLLLNTLQGYWCNLLRVRRAGILSRHRHPAAGARLRASRAAGTTSSTTGSPRRGRLRLRAAGRDPHPDRARGRRRR